MQDYSAFEAISQAQKIAFAPMLFQASIILLRQGVLALLDEHTKTGGVGVDAVVEKTALSPYAVALLLDVGESGELLYSEGVGEEKRYFLSKVGYFLLHDKMTQANLLFTQDVCYQGLFYLNESFMNAKPEGLKVFGDWPTIYPALSQLPPQVQESWFTFDHYYSDAAYTAALPHVFALNPKTINDVGGNTGKFSLKCCAYNADVQMYIVDLPEQIALAKANIAQQEDFSPRVAYYATDLLKPDATLPVSADVWWVSQFLDCFSPEEIIAILKKIRAQMSPASRVCILELFPDAQKFEASTFSLNMSSLYFTCMANGNSRFYQSEQFISYVEQAGLMVEKQVNDVGVGHSLLICRLA